MGREMEPVGYCFPRSFPGILRHVGCAPCESTAMEEGLGDSHVTPGFSSGFSDLTSL
jgi:hypothetical protein